MMPFLNLTGEESVDSALRLAIDGAEGAYKALKYIREHLVKAPTSDKQQLLEDSLSMYRGGYYNIHEQRELAGLVTQMNNGDAASRPFVFLGNNGDLSFFWHKDAMGNHAQLRLATVASIPDAEIKKRTAATLARCYIDGLLDYDAVTQTYTLSPQGAKHIYSGEFIQNRLLKEVTFFTKAEITLREQAEEINKRMAQRGFKDCNRVTVDRSSLAAKETSEGLFCRIPNTKGQDYICFKRGTFFPMNEKTVEVYIAPLEQYTVLDSTGKVKKTITGDELSKFYEVKQIAEQTPTPQTPVPQHPTQQTPVVPINGASYETGDYVFALNMYDSGYELNQYRIDYVVADKPTGEIIYKLTPTTPGQAEIIQSEHCAGITMFSGRAEGKAFLATDKGKAAADAIKAEFSKVAAEKIVTAPKFDLYTAAASAAYQSAEKIIRGLQK